MIPMNNIIKKQLQKTFNERIEIKKKIRTTVNGRKEETLESYYKCSSNIRDLYGKELYEAINIKLENVLSFEVRYCKKVADIRKSNENKNGIKDFVVIFEDKVYEIYQIDFKNNSRDIVTIKANGIT